LILDHQVKIIGPIRQELLSGIRVRSQFDRLRNYLSAFPDTAITTDDYVSAARFFNLCRSKGVQGSNTDFLICAVAVRNKFPIFTTDKDFEHFSAHLPIILHES
jgi:predicted nucleic acid-binding protein